MSSAGPRVNIAVSPDGTTSIDRSDARALDVDLHGKSGRGVTLLPQSVAK
jgi:hypothetical protein